MAHHTAWLCGCQDDELMAGTGFYFITSIVSPQGGGVYQVFRD
jgi:hypothetical protein